MNKFLVEVGQARVITPDCDRTDCVIQATGPTMTTCLGWTQTFDKWGNPLNSDPNTSSTPMKCVTCGKEWVSIK
jgi:hypothetical protein